jgi:hypothetical protein
MCASQLEFCIPLTHQLHGPRQTDHLGQHQEMHLILALSKDAEEGLLLEAFQTQHLIFLFSLNKLATNHKKDSTFDDMY